MILRQTELKQQHSSQSAATLKTTREKAYLASYSDAGQREIPSVDVVSSLEWSNEVVRLSLGMAEEVVRWVSSLLSEACRRGRGNALDDSGSRVYELGMETQLKS